MANHLKMDRKQAVLALLRLGWSYRRIERETGVRRETVAKHDPDRDSKAARAPTGGGENRPGRPPGQSLCEPWRELIEAKLKRGLDARRIHQDLVHEHGFAAGYDSVKRFCRRLRKSRPHVFARIETGPGEQLQADFFKGAPTRTESGRHRRPHVFRAVLSYSRHSYEEAVWRQDLPTFIRCFENAFRFFGGSVGTVRIDNLKAGITRACHYDPDVNEVFAAFARHHGFAVLPIRPRTPRENGKVERGHGYAESSALRGRRFDSLDEQNKHLLWWNENVARQRIHGTTKEQVLARFEREKPQLKPLPGQPFRLFRCGGRVVSADGHVEVDKAFYSVPHAFLGRELRVQWDERMVRIYDGETQVALHARQSAGRFRTEPEHLPVGKRHVHLKMEEHLLAKARAIGRDAGLWAEDALRERGVLAYRLLQGVISLTRRHPAETVNEACATALRHRAFRYRTLAALCKRQTPRQQPLFASEHELIRPLSEYVELLGKGLPR